MTDLEIFHNAPEGAAAAELAAYLDEACGGDGELRARVEALMAVGDGEDDYLEEVAVRGGGEGEGTVIGNYKLLQEIGVGGFGVVYMAEQLRPVKRRVALKIIKLGMDTKQVVARFEVERQALAMMDHPNIAKVFDAGATETGRPYFVMELVRGIPVTRFCDEQKLGAEARLRLFMDVCGAVQHAHQKGVIHRDLKPSNVMVTMHDDKPVPKVIDFGVAKATQSELTEQTLFTRFEQFIGTPAYMSPEQAQMSGLDIDTRSDIYSLGVLLYELLTGTTPFDPETLRSAGYEEIRRIIREEEPPKPSTRTRQTEVNGTADGRQQANPGELRGDLDWIVMKALEKDRARRYGTAGDLAADLQRHLEDEPVLAAAPGVAYRAGKYLRRHRVAIGMVALLAVAAVVSSWQAVRATGARKNEEVVRVKAEASERAGRHRLAEGFFGEGKAGLAVAHLCQLAREDGADGVAVERLVSALVYRDFPELIARVEAPDGDFRLGTSSTFLRGSGKVLIPVPAVGRLSVWDPEGQKTEWMSPGSGMRMGRIAVSRDERYVATQGVGRRVIVYEIDSGKEVHSFPCGSTVFWICFSPDGSKLLCGCEGATARVWNLDSGAERVYKVEDRNSDILCVDISADGRWAIAGGYFGAYLWDLEVEKPEDLKEGETMFNLGHGARVWSVHFSPDGTLVATGSGDHTAQVWSVASGERFGPPLQHRERVRHVVFSPDGSLLASASADDTVRIWDVALGQLFVPPLEHDGDVTLVEFDRTGQRVVTSAHGGGGSVRVWDVGSGKAIGAPLPHGEAASKSHFSPDGGAVMVGSLGDGAGLWKVPSARPTGRILRHRLRNDWLNFGGKVSSARYSEDGRQVVTATRYEGSWLWDAESCEAQGVFGRINGPGFGAWAALSPDGGAMVTTARGENSFYWELGEDGRKRWKLGKEVGRPWYTEFSPKDGEFLFLTSGKGQRIRVWRIEGGVPVSEALLSGTFSNVREDSLSRAHWAHFSPDGKRVIGATEEKVVGVWDLDTMKEPVLLRHSWAIESVAFHPDPESPLVLIGSRDGVAQVWDSVRGRQVFDTPLRHSDAVKFVTYRPDGKLIATASADGTARLWDAVTGEQYGQALHHGATVSMVRFSQDGRRVATASYDGTARVWDTASGLAVSEAFGHDAWVYSVDFSPDGKRLVSSGLDGTARIWDVAEVPLPAPGWFLQWAESVGGKRIEGGAVAALGWREIETIREGVMGRRGEGFYGELVAWFYAGVEERTITPFTPMTTVEYVEREMAAGTPESLEEAARVAPRDGVVLARLARNLKERYGESDPGGRRRGEYFAGLAERLLRERLAEDVDDLGAWRGVLEIGAGSAGDYEAAAAAVRRFVDRGRAPGERELGDCEGVAAAFEASGRKDEGLALRVAVVELMRASAPGDAATLGAVRRTATAALGVAELAVASEMMEVLAAVPGDGVEVTADWMLLAALHLRREDWASYGDLRRRMVARYAGGSEAPLLERAAKVFFFRPVADDVEVGETALAMARQSTEIATGAHEWMALCRGMAEYRAGNDEEALVWLAKARETSAPACLAVAYPFAAMAAHRAGRVEEARGFLEEGRAAVLKVEATGTVDGWHDRVFARLVLEEAEGVVE